MIWRCYYEKRGNHVHCRLFSGCQEGALGMNGRLCFTTEQFTEFTKLRKVIAMDFRNEAQPGGGPAGDLDVEFARLT